MVRPRTRAQATRTATPLCSCQRSWIARLPVPLRGTSTGQARLSFRCHSGATRVSVCELFGRFLSCPASAAETLEPRVNPWKLWEFGRNCAWWPQRDSNPCLSRATFSLIVTGSYEFSSIVREARAQTYGTFVHPTAANYGDLGAAGLKRPVLVASLSLKPVNKSAKNSV